MTEEIALVDEAVARFWPKVDRRDPDECWLWTAATNRRGYGLFNIDGRSRLAHRFAYELIVGPIPDGLELDHVAARGCTSTACVNPAHLEPVTHAENVRRGRAGLVNGARSAAKTHCPHGHAYDEANTRINRAGSRVCRECERANWRRWKAAQA